MAWGCMHRLSNREVALAPETPFDKELAELSQKLDATRLYYGNPRFVRLSVPSSQLKTRSTTTLRAIDCSGAVFNCTSSGAWNFAGHQELVSDITSGRRNWKTSARELPDDLQVKSVEELAALIKVKHEERESVQSQVVEVGRKRDEWLKAELAKKGARFRNSIESSSIHSNPVKALRDEPSGFRTVTVTVQNLQGHGRPFCQMAASSWLMLLKTTKSASAGVTSAFAVTFVAVISEADFRVRAVLDSIDCTKNSRPDNSMESPTCRAVVKEVPCRSVVYCLSQPKLCRRVLFRCLEHSGAELHQSSDIVKGWPDCESERRRLHPRHPFRLR